ncbi:hypothetical protein [Breoghania sp. L-A4]|uniref:hypothetical protein n=1 Tax=Breoghania sp. L-A4 TaxID=2304600 RepID=UPI0013C3311B|nr:hypothetical protein [Breoghania sp. L-A4]
MALPGDDQNDGRKRVDMNGENKSTLKPVKILLPDGIETMSPKQIILLMKDFGVGKENYASPGDAQPWSVDQFLSACSPERLSKTSPPEIPNKSTIEGWFSAGGPLPTEDGPRRYFFQVFFAEDRARFGTREWKDAYTAALDREKILKRIGETDHRARLIPLIHPEGFEPSDILPILRRERNALLEGRVGVSYSRDALGWRCERMLEDGTLVPISPGAGHLGCALMFNTLVKAAARATIRHDRIGEIEEPNWKRHLREILSSPGIGPRNCISLKSSTASRAIVPSCGMRRSRWKRKRRPLSIAAPSMPSFSTV